MARTYILVLISWIIALCFILGAVVYEIESEPVVDLPSVTDSFSEDIRDILDLLRMFISLIETANQRLARVLKLQLVSTIPPKNLEKESLDVLFNRFEAACQSFRIRFLNFMAAQATNPRAEKLQEDKVNEGFSDFKHSVINSFIEELGTETQNMTSLNEFDVKVDSVSETSDESIIDTTKTVECSIEAESRSIDETDDSSMKKEGTKSADVTLLEGTKATINRLPTDSSTKEDNRTAKEEYLTDSFTDDGEVTIEEDESSTESLINETSSISNKILTDETVIAENDRTDRFNSAETSNLFLDHSSKHGTSTISEEDKEGGNVSADIADLQLRTQNIDAELEFLHRLNFDEGHQRPLLVSMIGAPGKHFPNYSRMPETSFTCEDKKHIPGVYADHETKCQVFHVCWPHKMESFLCPIGTIFSQQIQSCDYWFSSTCSFATNYFHLNSNFLETLRPINPETVYSSIILYRLKRQNSLTVSLISKMKFMPIHFKVTDYPTEYIYFDDPELNKLEELFPKIKKDSKFSKEEIDLARKIYDELFHLPQNFDAKNDKSTALDTLFQKMKLKKQKTNIDISPSKTDRSGLVSEIEATENSNLEVTESTYSDLQTTELDTTTTNESTQLQNNHQKPSFKIKHHSNHMKNQIAPEIVFKALKTVQSVLNQGILPLTREMLAASYSKLPKRKKL